ncbi:uncharacterized protein EI90DRAFT_3119375 [Cantharellus anzutake]|uniref:uncharacterized protein n=1 Tax=Cantharellus anzutake TaxID=1750568 RepID=UPI00190643F6|nr:uncharacterized protein EI90DRAFT_3119375 [Cantharellus anzutake]KAF8337042.1 hypothetical protein EI90DRAFT_3119375 [Cantharellus anzutake]
MPQQSITKLFPLLPAQPVLSQPLRARDAVHLSLRALIGSHQLPALPPIHDDDLYAQVVTAKESGRLVWRGNMEIHCYTGKLILHNFPNEDISLCDQLRGFLHSKRTLGMLSQRYGLYRVSGMDLSNKSDDMYHANLFKAYVGGMRLALGDHIFQQFLNDLFLALLSCAVQTLGVLPRADLCTLPINAGRNFPGTSSGNKGDSGEEKVSSFKNECTKLGFLPEWCFRDSGERITSDYRFRVTTYYGKHLISIGYGPTRYAAMVMACRDGIETLLQLASLLHVSQPTPSQLKEGLEELNGAPQLPGKKRKSDMMMPAGILQPKKRSKKQ